ncbi:hypothetical protein G7Y89_g2548 [Cudoniella acicularis]|uniref:Uncharacterized protein n=1 Tax=Cudoniella acicularis TaxID=354080 RepID=A0A8H4RW31_9HELO|nr:hypothetical protein G7Y89_g2548 [Cudoniella acicularis]
MIDESRKNVPKLINQSQKRKPTGQVPLSVDVNRDRDSGPSQKRHYGQSPSSSKASARPDPATEVIDLTIEVIDLTVDVEHCAICSNVLRQGQGYVLYGECLLGSIPEQEHASNSVVLDVYCPKSDHFDKGKQEARQIFRLEYAICYMTSADKIDQGAPYGSDLFRTSYSVFDGDAGRPSYLNIRQLPSGYSHLADQAKRLTTLREIFSTRKRIIVVSGASISINTGNYETVNKERRVIRLSWVLITCIQANVDPKLVPGESGYKGAKIGSALRDKESVTGPQGSQNEPLGALKWPLNPCSGLLCRRPLLLTTAHLLPTLASPLLTLAHPALPIKQPCSPFRTEMDFVQVRIQVKQPAVLSEKPPRYNIRPDWKTWSVSREIDGLTKIGGLKFPYLELAIPKPPAGFQCRVPRLVLTRELKGKIRDPKTSDYGFFEIDMFNGPYKKSQCITVRANLYECFFSGKFCNYWDFRQPGLRSWIESLSGGEVIKIFPGKYWNLWSQNIEKATLQIWYDIQPLSTPPPKLWHKPRLIQYQTNLFNKSGIYHSIMPTKNQDQNQVSNSSLSHIIIGSFHLPPDQDMLWLDENPFPSDIHSPLLEELNNTSQPVPRLAQVTLTTENVSSTQEMERALAALRMFLDMCPRICGLDLNFAIGTTTEAAVYMIDRLITPSSTAEETTITPMITISAPATAFQGSDSSTTLNYETLEMIRRSQISWYNVQFHTFETTFLDLGQLELIYRRGWLLQKIVACVGIDSSRKDTFVSPKALKLLIPALAARKPYPVFGGLANLPTETTSTAHLDQQQLDWFANTSSLLSKYFPHPLALSTELRIFLSSGTNQVQVLDALKKYEGSLVSKAIKTTIFPTRGVPAGMNMKNIDQHTSDIMFRVMMRTIGNRPRYIMFPHVGEETELITDEAFEIMGVPRSKRGGNKMMVMVIGKPE